MRIVQLLAAVVAISACQSLVAQPTTQPTAQPVPFDFAIDKPVSTSAGVYDRQGRLLRTLWTMRPMDPGKHTAEWDGCDESATAVAASAYEVRVVTNPSVYRNVGALGNTKRVPTVQTAIAGIAIDDEGGIYCANRWEEAGQDFNKLDRNGNTLLHANFRVRNGTPNGFPYAIAISGQYLYLSVITRDKLDEKTTLWGGHVVRRFNRNTGDPAPLSAGDNFGNIRVYTAGREVNFSEPLKALAIVGKVLLIADQRGDRILKFDKDTGAAAGEFGVKQPTALSGDAAGRLWVAHEASKVSIVDLDGRMIATPLEQLNDVPSLTFSRNGQLHVADRGASQVKIYDVRGNLATLVRTFGTRVRPGDWAPDRFYKLSCVAVDAAGSMVVGSRTSTGGARISRFALDGRCLWDHLGLEFCSIGNYSQSHPDEFIDTRFNRLLLKDREKGESEYRGTLLNGDEELFRENHGVPKIIRLGENEFFCQSYGDGMMLLRRAGDSLRPACIIAGRNPRPDGKYNDKLPKADRSNAPALWSWTDSNGDGKMQATEVDVHKLGRGADVRYVTFGINIDSKGNLLYCEHHTRAIWELPLDKLDANGNPVYDWSKARQFSLKDATPLEFFPLMATRSNNGVVYAFGRSGFTDKTGLWKSPKNRGAWMGGWVLRGFDAKGNVLFTTRLPQVCVGMDVIPGRIGNTPAGVMLGWYEKGVIYHYTPDGLLIGQMQVGEACDKSTGWMDNTSALTVNRDPRDGIIDVFGEDSLNNRILWYRVDDKDIGTIRIPVTVK